MTILLAVLSTLFFILYLHERNRNKSVYMEIMYIKERISETSRIKENKYILLPSEHTEIKELAAELNRLLEIFYQQKVDYEHAKGAMEQMLTNISHDLRTPLTVLKGYSELLKKETKHISISSQIESMILKIDLKASELASIINAYFTMSKMASGDISIQLYRTNITEICHEIMLDYYDILEKAQYEVNILICPEPVFADVDTEALKRILKNLVDNAIKHGSTGKYLGIRLQKAPGKVMIEIEDHGQGIQHKDLERIFSRNYTTAHRNSGSGLGLAIAKNLALQMNGDILVDSEPDIKTVFTLVLKS